MLQIVFKKKGLSTCLHLLKNMASPIAVFNHHHYLAPCSFQLKGIFISQHLGMSLLRLWSPSHGIDNNNSRRFCSLRPGELEKALVVSDSINPVTSEITGAADKMFKIVTDYSKPEHKMENALDHSGIELTTPLVMKILERVRYDEKIAFRFFTWAGSQEYYRHEACAYNLMIDILSCTGYKVKQFRTVCDMLDYMKRKKSNSVPADALFVMLRKYAEKHLVHLHKFSLKNRYRSRTQPETYAFNLFLDAMCKCSLAREAEAMFRRVLRQSKVKPVAETYNILFFGWCRVRNPKRGIRILEEMISLGFTPDNFTYNTAIDTFCKSGLIAEAAELFEFMKTQGSKVSSPTAKTYSIMIMALVENDRMEHCFEVINDMMVTGCLPDVSTYQTIIECMCSNGKIEAAYRVLDEMGKKGYPADVVTYNCFVKALCGNKQSDEVLRLYQKMIEVRCMPSVQTYNMMIEMYHAIGDIEGAFEAWHEMDRTGCERNIDTCCVMIDGLFNSNNPKEACSLLEELISKGVELPYEKFDSFLKQLSAIGDLQSIHELSNHMRKSYNPAMSRRYTCSQRGNSRRLRGK